jgi:Fur family peroxide stress response transcriptional regulator
MNQIEQRKNRLHEAFAKKGMRYTKQREQIYNILLDKRDHPTAEEIFLRARERMGSISFATVYNCLDTLVECDLVRQVHIDRESTRYCPNLTDHAHLHCPKTGEIHDINLPKDLLENIRAQLPEDFTLSSVEILIRGTSQNAQHGNDS